MLDTDDIVAIPVFCVQGVIFAILVVLCFTQRMIVIRTHMLEKMLTRKNNIFVYKVGDEEIVIDKSLLWVIIGDQKYFDFIAYIREKHHIMTGKDELPSSKEIDDMISPILMHRLLVSEIHPDKFT
jgi:hypothetical protein